MSEQVSAEATPAPEEAQFDYSSLLEKVQESTPQEKAPVEAEATPKEEANAEAEAPETAPEEKGDKPGTPDKELQKTQQRLASVDQRLEKLLAAVEKQGGKPTEAQVEKAEELKAEKDELADMLAEDRIPNLDEDHKTIAKRVIETEKKQGDELNELRSEVAAMRAERAWEKETVKFPGVDVQKVWKDSTEAAIKEIEEEVAEEESISGTKLTEKQVEARAYARTRRIYAKRAEEAKLSIAAKKEPVSDKKTARETPAKPTPGSAHVQTGNRSITKPVDSLDATPEEYAALIKH